MGGFAPSVGLFLSLIHISAPCTTKDGTRISLMADCASVEDVRTAVEAGADGVGLLLSEYLLLAGRVNGEEEQYGFYAACLAAAQGRPVTICTLSLIHI